MDGTKKRGGTGTVVMHKFSDEIGYHMSEQGGLIVSLKFDTDEAIIEQFKTGKREFKI